MCFNLYYFNLIKRQKEYLKIHFEKIQMYFQNYKTGYTFLFIHKNGLKIQFQLTRDLRLQPRQVRPALNSHDQFVLKMFVQKILWVSAIYLPFIIINTLTSTYHINHNIIFLLSTTDARRTVMLYIWKCKKNWSISIINTMQ